MLTCPYCRQGKTVFSGEPDEVECSCNLCGTHFTVGEARRGHTYVKEENRDRKIQEIENRLNALEDQLKREGRL